MILNIMSFKKLNAPLKEALKRLGYENPLPFQKNVISRIKSGKNIFGFAPDGSGKTTAMIISTIQILEIGLDGDHVHFLIQSVPMNAPKNIIGAVKSITAKEIFRLHPEVKQMLWGGKFWTCGYYVKTVGQYSSEEVIKKYIQKQGKSEYTELHKNQLRLF
jgi:hypothetical protein